MYRYNAKNNPNGYYIPGVPLRDLSNEDFEALTKPQQTAVQQSPLYAKVRAAKKDGDK